MTLSNLTEYGAYKDANLTNYLKLIGKDNLTFYK